MHKDRVTTAYYGLTVHKQGPLNVNNLILRKKKKERKYFCHSKDSGERVGLFLEHREYL